MAYTASEIITMAQRLLVDVEDDAYLDDMLSYFNEWQRRFATETQCVQKVEPTSVRADTYSYADLARQIDDASDLVDVARVELIDNSGVGTAIYPLPKSELSDLKTLPLTASIFPTRYSLFAKQILFDLHSSADVSFVIRVYCSIIPNDLTSTDATTLIPDQWAQAGVHYLCYCARISDRDANLANGHFAEYEAIRMQAALLYKSQMEA